MLPVNKRIITKVTWSLTGLILLGIMLNLTFPFPKAKLYPPPSTTIFDSDGNTLRVYISSKGEYLFPVTLDDIPDYVINSTLIFEDRYFFYHPGFNPISILRAVYLNFKAGKIVAGGSTITQQIVRLIEPRPRTISSKVIELFRALQIEVSFTKSEILEFYFNLAPYGGNIVGVEAAAKIYFGKSAQKLGPGEAALLSALPNSPTKLRPDLHPSAAKFRRDEILTRMLNSNAIDESQYKLALGEEIPLRRKSFPLHAPHFSDLINASANNNSEIITTIDIKTQELCRRLLSRHLSTHMDDNIANGAIVVIENSTGSVRALVGSADYFNPEIDGQVNGAISSRSPGSTLKPFVYGLALDKGIISPSTLLEDLPQYYGGYRPKNFDEVYSGVVSAEEALIRSMNVPAVYLVKKTGYGYLYNFLKEGGFTTLTEEKEHYGLQLILGGVGVKLLELTNLYSCLSRGGVYKPYRMLESDDYSDGWRILSEDACYILTEILCNVKRPDFPKQWQYSPNLPKIAWKTGTSYGHRDAWSIGYTPRYTVGVWMGSFSGEGYPDLIGVRVAGPLLFDIFSEFEHEDDWFLMPENVFERKVCSVSGMFPGNHCPLTKTELYIPGVSPNVMCHMHVMLVLDDNTGHRLCSNCQVTTSKSSKVFIRWDQKISNWLVDNGYRVDDIPSHNPLCRTLADGFPPMINSPTDDGDYVIRAGIPIDDQKILFDASVASDVKTIFWFLDGNLIHQGSPLEQYYFTPVSGRHEVVCMDDEGRRSRRSLKIYN